MRVLLASNMYPSASDPALGVFVRAHMTRMESHHGIRFVPVVSSASPRSFAGKVLKYGQLGAKATRSLGAGCDLVHLHYASPPHLLATLPCWLRPDAPLVVTIHGGDLEQPPVRHLGRRLVSAALARAGAVITVSEALRNLLLERFAVPAEKIRVISMGCDLGLFRRRAHPDTGLAAHVPEGPKVVLFVGQLQPWKGCDVLLDALSGLPAEEQPWVAIAGEGPERPALVRRLRGTNLEPRVVWLGVLPQPELARWYARADLLVLPSRKEALGLAALEAMASGTPVVASAVGGLPELIADGASGLLCVPGDVEGLRACVRTALADGALRERLAAAAESRVVEHALDRQVARVVEVYRGLREHASALRSRAGWST